MTENLDELEDLIYDTNDNKAKMILLERAVAMAENQKEFARAYNFRSDLVELGTFHGFPLKAIVAFSQNLKYADEHSDEIDKWNLLWEYKWVIGMIPKFYQVDYEQIFSMLEDFKKRSLEYGDTLNAYYTMCYFVCERMKDIEGMKKYHELRFKTPEGNLSNCSVCVVDDRVEFKAVLEGFDAGIKEAKEIFDNKLSCGSVPQNTYYNLIKQGLKEKRFGDVDKLRTKALRLIKNDEKFVGDHGFHILTFIANGKMADAFKVFKKYYIFTNNKANSGIEFYDLYLGFSILFEKMVEQGESEVVIPFDIDNVCEKGHSVNVKVLRDFMNTKVEEFAKAFDKRNRSTTFMDEVEEFREIFLGN